MSMSVVVATLRERTALWEFVDNRLTLVRRLEARGLLADVYEIRATYLARGRNEAVRRFLESGATHLFFLDSDVIVPIGAVERLLQNEAPIVSGLYFQKVPPYLPEAYRWTGELYESVGRSLRSGLDGIPLVDEPMLGPRPLRLNVDAVGAGCLLIARQGLEKLDETPFGPTESGRGEDMWFCGQAKAAGFDIVLDWSILCGHLAVLPVGQARFRLATPLPKSQVLVPRLERVH